MSLNNNSGKNILKIFLVLMIMFIISCDASPTNWQFVNQYQVDTLLQSPEIIDFEGGKYELICQLLPSSLTKFRSGGSFYSKTKIIFYLSGKNGVSNNLTKPLKVTGLWIINKPYKYYFEATNFQPSNDKNEYSLEPPSYYHPVNNTETGNTFDFLIVKFVSNNRSYFIKTFMNSFYTKVNYK